jgi:uncharacterized membrane protein
MSIPYEFNMWRAAVHIHKRCLLPLILGLISNDRISCLLIEKVVIRFSCSCPTKKKKVNGGHPPIPEFDYRSKGLCIGGEWLTVYIFHLIMSFLFSVAIYCFLLFVNYAMLLLQQYSKQLEETMERFSQGEIKILICTNIVESGLDIQNANTIIIQDVQQFGLAQLYQVCSFCFPLML